MEMEDEVIWATEVHLVHHSSMFFPRLPQVSFMFPVLAVHIGIASSTSRTPVLSQAVRWKMRVNQRALASRSSVGS